MKEKQKCETCDAVFNTPEELIQHQRVHEMERAKEENRAARN